MVEQRATITELWAARLGPAAVCAAALAVPLFYLPSLDSVFSEPKLALLLVAGALGLGCHTLALASGAPRPRWPAGLAAALAALLASTGISAGAALLRAAPGAPYAKPELLRLVAVAGVALAATRAVADPRWRRRLFQSIHVAAGLVSLIGLLQHLQLLPGPLAIPIISVPGATFGNRNVAAEAVALAIPFGLGLLFLEGPLGGGASARGRQATMPAPTTLFLAVELVYLAVTRTRGAWLGGALGAGAFFALYRPPLPRSARLLILALGAVALIAALVPGRFNLRDANDAKRYQPGQRVVLDALDPTAPVARTRLGLWRRTLALSREHPLLGIGPGNFAVLFPRYAEPGATADGVLCPSVAPRRAHNDLLERLAETGVLGLGALLAVFYAGAAIAVGRARRRPVATEAAQLQLEEGGRPATTPERERDRDAVTAAGAASLVALITCGLTGFPLAMPATALLFGVALGALAAVGDGAAAETDRRRPRFAAPVAWILAAALLAAAASVSARRLAASYWLGRAESSLRDARPDARADAQATLGPERALEFLARAERVSPDQFRVALLTSRADLRLERSAQALDAADRALAREPYSPNAWAARADAHLHARDYPAAASDARRATALLADYPAAVAVLARADAGLGDRAGEREARDRLVVLAAQSEEARRLLDALGPASAPPAEQHR